MHGLKDVRTARLILDGWLLYYNFMRKHETLGKTPAEASGIKFPYKNWQEVVSDKKSVTPSQTSVTSRVIIPEFEPASIPIRKTVKYHRVKKTQYKSNIEK